MPLPTEQTAAKQRGWTVADLITELQKHPPGQFAIIAGYEGGYSDVSQLTMQRINLFVNKDWFYGPHDYVAALDDCDELAIQIG